MICARPFRRGVQEFGCGQCMPCRMNRRRVWTNRLMLEATQHQASFFVTLTYADEHLPVGGNVVPKHLQDFLKRLREHHEYGSIRYYAVGEYGDVSNRPHYHLALFGLPDVELVFERGFWVLHSVSVSSAWVFGHVHIGQLTEQSAAYIVSYVMKGATKYGDSRLGGLHPEFSRMSLRPGIGAGAMPVIGDAVVSRDGARGISATGDVPSALRWQGKLWPLGRYLRGKLRIEAGFVDSRQPERAAIEGSLRKQAELSVPENWRKRENLRIQVEQNALSRNAISRSKKWRM